VCRCTVPKQYISTFGARRILEDVGFFTYFPALITANNETLLMYLHALQDTGSVGDMFTSSGKFKVLQIPCNDTLLD
jgi:hypothetical protein